MKLSHKITVAIFFVLLILLPLLTFLVPKDRFSENENRYRTEIPAPTAENIFDRSFMDNFEKHFADYFPWRESFIGAKTRLELLAGKKESGGVFILPDRLIEKYASPNLDTIHQNVDAINRFADYYDIPVYLMIAPTAQGVYEDMLPAQPPAIQSQKAMIEDNIYWYRRPQITTIDVLTPLTANKDQYIYYRTDHHWTTRGAYVAYEAAASKLGFQPIPLSQFDIEHASSDFRGTLFSKTLYDGVEPDVLDFYHNASTDATQVLEVEVLRNGKMERYDSMYFREYLSKKDKYSAFLGDNQPMVTVKTNSQTGKKLLMFKDSYAHSMVPFLKEHYSEITMLDMRYINVAFTELVNVEEYDQVMFLYNLIGFSEDDSLKKLDFVTAAGE